MKFDNCKVDQAAKAIDELCLKCESHTDSCYVAVAKRAIATIQKKNNKKGGE